MVTDKTKCFQMSSPLLVSSGGREASDAPQSPQSVPWHTSLLGHGYCQIYTMDKASKLPILVGLVGRWKMIGWVYVKYMQNLNSPVDKRIKSSLNTLCFVSLIPMSKSALFFLLFDKAFSVSK